MKTDMHPGEFAAQSSLQSNELLRLVHHHPGYLRVQANTFIGAKDDSLLLTAARTTAEATPGFLRWSHNPGTGSVVVEYRPGSLDPDDLLDHVAKNAGLAGVIEDIHNSDHRKGLIDGLLDAVQDVNRLVYEASGGKADLREVVPAGLLLTSAVSFVLGEDRGFLPRWDSSLYKSYRIFMQFHRQEVRKREKRERKARKRLGTEDLRGALI
jgi:hypothetical protein